MVKTTDGNKRKAIVKPEPEATVHINEFLAAKSVRPEHAAGFCLKNRARTFRPLSEWESLFKEYTKK